MASSLSRQDEPNHALWLVTELATWHYLFFKMQLCLQFQHLHYYYTNICAYNILANYINYATYTYTPYTCISLQYDTKKMT